VLGWPGIISIYDRFVESFGRGELLTDDAVKPSNDEPALRGSKQAVADTDTGVWGR